MSCITSSLFGHRQKQNEACGYGNEQKQQQIFGLFV